MMEEFSKFFSWMNTNQGVLTFLIFLATLILGWGAGIFSALRHRPKLRVDLIDGPTFSCTYLTGGKHDGFDAHRTGIALYLLISNYGSAPTSVTAVEVGYHWHLRPFSTLWWKYRVGWFWLTNQSVALADFQVSIGNNTKVYPFLTQMNHLSDARPKTYLRIGEATNGVVYFEQNESWGGCFPSPKLGYTRIKVRLRDAHGREYTSGHKIPIIEREDALKYNPRFGETHQELSGEFLPNEEDEITTGDPDLVERADRSAK